MSADTDALYNSLLKQAQKQTAHFQSVASECSDSAIRLIEILYQCEDREVRSRIAEGLRLFLNKQLLQMQSI